eukprot:7379446-Prymnesium_polylepis.1
MTAGCAWREAARDRTLAGPCAAPPAPPLALRAVPPLPTYPAHLARASRWQRAGAGVAAPGLRARPPHTDPPTLRSLDPRSRGHGPTRSFDPSIHDPAATAPHAPGAGVSAPGDALRPRRSGQASYRHRSPTHAPAFTAGCGVRSSCRLATSVWRRQRKRCTPSRKGSSRSRLISTRCMVDLLGGIKPASSWQGGRIIGGFACGRRGSPQGPTAFEDTERALRALAPI